MNPPISVVLSVYNNVTELPRALESVLAQTHQDFEVIAIDDGSTDGSGELLDRYASGDSRIRVIHQENQGLGPALARGCSLARGTYIARQDADDVSAPTRFRDQLQYLESHPDVVLCGAGWRSVHPVEGVIAESIVPNDPARLVRILESGSNPFVHGTVMLRRATYERLDSGYRLRRYCEEYDLWLRLSQLGRLASLESVQYYYWLSPAGMSFGNFESRERLVSLCLQLHQERRVHGREITSWREAEAEILATTRDRTDAPARAAAGAYASGIEALAIGAYQRYRAQMRTAAAGDGPFARRARLHVRFRWAAPLLRGAYRFRMRDTVQAFARSAPRNTNIPGVARLSGDPGQA